MAPTSPARRLRPHGTSLAEPPDLTHPFARCDHPGGRHREPGGGEHPEDPRVAGVEQVIAAPRLIKPARAVEPGPEANWPAVAVTLILLVDEARHRVEALAGQTELDGALREAGGDRVPESDDVEHAPGRHQ